MNIFHKEPLTAHHFLCATPPYGAADDAHAMLRAMKVEVGDFGRAKSLSYATKEPVVARSGQGILVGSSA